MAFNISNVIAENISKSGITLLSQSDSDKWSIRQAKPVWNVSLWEEKNWNGNQATIQSERISEADSQNFAPFNFNV